MATIIETPEWDRKKREIGAELWSQLQSLPPKTGAGSVPHSASGPWMRTIEQAERDAVAARLRSRSLSYRDIGALMKVDHTTARDMVERAMRDVVREPAEELVKRELEKMDNLEQKLLAIAEKRRPVVSQGKVISEVDDDGPSNQAIAQLRQLSESRRKLLGLDSVQKVEVSGGVTWEIKGVADGDMK